MKTKKADLAVDCVAMKRAAQAKLAEKTRGMTHAEEIAFYEREAATGPMADYWRSIRSKEGTGLGGNRAASGRTASRPTVGRKASTTARRAKPSR